MAQRSFWQIDCAIFISREVFAKSKVAANQSNSKKEQQYIFFTRSPKSQSRFKADFVPDSLTQWDTFWFLNIAMVGQKAPLETCDLWHIWGDLAELIHKKKKRRSVDISVNKCWDGIQNKIYRNHLGHPSRSPGVRTQSLGSVLASDSEPRQIENKTLINPNIWESRSSMTIHQAKIFMVSVPIDMFCSIYSCYYCYDINSCYGVTVLAF